MSTPIPGFFGLDSDDEEEEDKNRILVDDVCALPATNLRGEKLLVLAMLWTCGRGKECMGLRILNFPARTIG